MIATGAQTSQSRQSFAGKADLECHGRRFCRGPPTRQTSSIRFITPSHRDITVDAQSRSITTGANGLKNRNFPAQIKTISDLHHRATYRRGPFAKRAQPDWQRMKEKHDEGSSQANVLYCDPCSAVDSRDPFNEYVPRDDSRAQVIGFKEWKLYGCNRRIVDRRCVRRSLAVAGDALEYLFLRGME